MRLKPYQVCNITAKNNFGATQDVFFITLMPKKTYEIHPVQAIFYRLERLKTAGYGLLWLFSAGLTFLWLLLNVMIFKAKTVPPWCVGFMAFK